MDERGTGVEEDRWDAPNEAQRASGRARVRSESTVASQSGGVKMKWVFVWLVASAFAVLMLRNIDVVERFESRMLKERKQGMTLSDDVDLDQSADESDGNKNPPTFNEPKTVPPVAPTSLVETNEMKKVQIY